MSSIWGKDVPNSRVLITCSWNKSLATNTDKEGNWNVKIATPQAGGPYTLTIEGSQKIVLKNVLIGEVWFCSGQSNMEMPLRGYANQPITGSKEAIANANNKNIRLFNVARKASLTPLNDVSGKWVVTQPQTVKDFSAVSYFFGKTLNDTLNVPIGLICAAWGASKIEAWMDEETILKFKNIKIEKEIPVAKPQRSPFFIYNGMIHPLQGFTIRGFIWYQGEGNRPNAKEYASLFPAMINQWRTQWGQGRLPFYFVQIAPFGKESKIPVGALLRESQLKTLQKVPNTGMAVTMDIGDCEMIHPPDKRTVGERLAYWALAKDYNIEGISYSGPLYKKMTKAKNGKVILYFDYSENGLSSFGNSLTGFEVAGFDRVFYPAIAEINNDGTVTVFSKQVKQPIAVRYGFKNCPEGTLFNTNGLPASPFRTDNWE
ncbi:sialate O-acetylesterase [Gaetbulibacter saemankumensis]|uniref:sialate O-acetylesterase n=1 Tax=Gaetbulibacter saemankumensis TaxID=311208 RepID=UPI0003FE3904|nr:sialate O-acetylesterase [Gaetbulibacter saemankumensis]